MEIREIKSEVRRRGITRICHFTKSIHIPNILRTGYILSRNNLDQNDIEYSCTDPLRLDGCLEGICCTIEYPNAWYFDKAINNEKIFRDWVIIFIDPKYIWQEGTKFSPYNAARNFGSRLEEGYTAFSSLFASSINGRKRGTSHLLCCPTDDQAEVIIPNQISVGDILYIGVYDSEQAETELSRLDQLKIKCNHKFFNVPALYKKRKLCELIRNNTRPQENEHEFKEFEVNNKS